MTSEPSDPHPRPRPRPAPSSRAIATGAVLLALIVAAFEGTVVTSVMPTIVADLGGIDVYAWVFSAFLVASTIGVLACGKLADAFGRRPIFAGGMGLFLLGSALCGAAQSIEALILFRVLQGLGAGAIQPIAMTISADIYTLRERANVQALFTAVWGAANALGPILGGAIATRFSWRWVFWVNVPIGALAVLVLFASYRDPARTHRGPTGVAGTLLAGAAAALLLVALEPGGTLALRDRLWPALGALLATFALVAQQRRTPRPILPPALLRDRVVRAGVLGGLFAGGLLYACAAYVPLWLTRQRGESAVIAGASLIPLLVGWALGSTFGVRILVRWGMRVSTAGGFALAFAGAVMLAIVVLADHPPPLAYASLVLLGLGLGPAASTALVAPQSHVAWQHRGMITSAIYAARTLGGSLIVAALGALGMGESAPALRFLGVAALALAALITMALLAPTQLREASAEDAAFRST